MKYVDFFSLHLSLLIAYSLNPSKNFFCCFVSFDETISRLMEKLVEISANQNSQMQPMQVQHQVIEKIVEKPVEVCSLRILSTRQRTSSVALSVSHTLRRELSAELSPWGDWQCFHNDGKNNHGRKAFWLPLLRLPLMPRYARSWAHRTGPACPALSGRCRFPCHDRGILCPRRWWRWGLAHVLGFGADICTWAHLRYLEKNPGKKLISQPCAAVVNYVQRHKPDLC